MHYSAEFKYRNENYFYYKDLNQFRTRLGTRIYKMTVINSVTYSVCAQQCLNILSDEMILS